MTLRTPWVGLALETKSECRDILQQHHFWAGLMAIFRVAVLLFIKPKLEWAVVISPHSSFGLIIIKSSTATRNIAIKLNLPKNDVVVIALHSDSGNTHEEWSLLHASLKKEIQLRVSSIQFILRCVVLCIQKTLTLECVSLKKLHEGMGGGGQ